MWPTTKRSSLPEEGKEEVLTDIHYPKLGFRFPFSKLFPPSECEFEGRIFHCPRDPDFVLTQEFGSDWRTPKENFKPDMVDIPPPQPGQ